MHTIKVNLNFLYPTPFTISRSSFLIPRFSFPLAQFHSLSQLPVFTKWFTHALRICVFTKTHSPTHLFIYPITLCTHTCAQSLNHLPLHSRWQNRLNNLQYTSITKTEIKNEYLCVLASHTGSNSSLKRFKQSQDGLLRLKGTAKKN